MIILDTNVVSEFMRPAPDVGVTSWLDSLTRGEIWTTSITVAELAAGIGMLPNGQRRDRLDDALREALHGFGDRILSFTPRTALAYGPIVGTCHQAGRPISIADAQIAAIVATGGATLATRNVKDFDGTGIAVFNPWASDASPDAQA